MSYVSVIRFFCKIFVFSLPSICCILPKNTCCGISPKNTCCGILPKNTYYVMSRLRFDAIKLTEEIWINSVSTRFAVWRNACTCLHGKFVDSVIKHFFLFDATKVIEAFSTIPPPSLFVRPCALYVSFSLIRQQPRCLFFSYPRTRSAKSSPWLLFRWVFNEYISDR